MKTCKKCGGDAIVGIEYQYGSKYRFDGISEWKCFDCGYRQGRFCEEELTGHECERPYCDGKGKHPTEVFLDE